MNEPHEFNAPAWPKSDRCEHYGQAHCGVPNDAEIHLLDEIGRMNADELIRQRRVVEAQRDAAYAAIRRHRRSGRPVPAGLWDVGVYEVRP